MAYIPHNFIDKQGPVVDAAFLNSLDATVNRGLNGLSTQSDIAAWLGVASPTNPVPISLGGTGQSTAPAALAALGGTTLNAATIVQTAAEANAGLTIVNQQYPPGNFLRYGIVPNVPAAAANNQTILGNLLEWSTLNGPTGLIYSPNTGGTITPDTYYFSGATNTIRDWIILDLNGTTWNFNKTSQYSDNNNGFLWCMRNVTIQNGNIVATYDDGGGPGTGGLNPGPGGTQQPNSFSVIYMGGRDNPVAGSILPPIFDSIPTPPQTVAAQMGNITLRNLSINGSSAISQVMYGVIGLGGLNRVRIDNVAIEGNASLVNGLYYEFGWATNEARAQSRQTSHAHDWVVTNFTVTNTSLASPSNGGYAMNGAYNIIMDNVHVSNSPTIVSFGTGESMFFRPWVGVDDFGSLTQNGASPLAGTAAAGRTISLRNITGRQIGTGTGISCAGATWPSGWHVAGVVAWQPNTVYVAGGTPSVVYNGCYKYTCTTGGTSSNTAGFTGPRGTSGAITDGTVVWSYTANAGGTGYNGYNQNYSYQVGNTTINGQYIYTCTTGGTSGATSQGPTGVGTGISDGALVWSSVPSSSGTGVPANSAWPASTDQLNLILDGFTVDSGTTGTLSGGYGVNTNCGSSTIRNGKITNMNRGISVGGDQTQVVIDGVTVLNSGGDFGMQISAPSPSVWTPARLMQGAIRNCFIAGTSTAGAAPGYGIILSQCQSFLIENNRFGYELIHDGIAEPTQQYAVFLPVFTGAISPYNGVICRSNYVNCAGGGSAYFMYPTTLSYGCAIDDPLGPVQTYAGGWEGVLQSTTPTLTCATPGNLAITYAVQALDYIKRGNKVDFSLELTTSAFSWTTASGNVSITGLPYVSNNSVVGSLPIMAMAFQGITKGSYTQFSAVGSGGQSTLTITCSGSGQTESTLQIADMPTGGAVKLFIAGHYFTSI